MVPNERRTWGQKKTQLKILDLEVLIEGTLYLQQTFSHPQKPPVSKFQMIDILHCFWWLGMTSKSHSAPHLLMTGTEDAVTEFTHHLLFSTQSLRYPSPHTITSSIWVPLIMLWRKSRRLNPCHTREIHTVRTLLSLPATDHENRCPAGGNFLS